MHHQIYLGDRKSKIRRGTGTVGEGECGTGIPKIQSEYINILIKIKRTLPSVFGIR